MGLRESFFVDGVAGAADDVWDLFTKPEEAWEGLVYVASSPFAAAEAMWSSIRGSWQRNRERTVGAGTFEVITLPFAALKVTKLARLAKVAKLAKLRVFEHLPRAALERFGHVSKHAPKSADEVAKLAVDEKVKRVTWFKDVAAMDDAIRAAPDALQQVLRSDPVKLEQFMTFLKNPKEGAAGRFGFVYDAGKPIGEGLVRTPASGRSSPSAKTDALSNPTQFPARPRLLPSGACARRAGASPTLEGKS